MDLKLDDLNPTDRRYILVGVTRRQHRAESRYPVPARKLSRCKEGLARSRYKFVK